MKALLQAGRNGRVPASPEKRFLITTMGQTYPGMMSWLEKTFRFLVIAYLATGALNVSAAQYRRWLGEHGEFQASAVVELGDDLKRVARGLPKLAGKPLTDEQLDFLMQELARKNSVLVSSNSLGLVTNALSPGMTLDTGTAWQWAEFFTIFNRMRIVASQKIEVPDQRTIEAYFVRNSGEDLLGVLSLTIVETRRIIMNMNMVSGQAASFRHMGEDPNSLWHGLCSGISDGDVQKQYARGALFHEYAHIMTSPLIRSSTFKDRLAELTRGWVGNPIRVAEETAGFLAHIYGTEDPHLPLAWILRNAARKGTGESENYASAYGRITSALADMSGISTNITTLEAERRGHPLTESERADVQKKYDQGDYFRNTSDLDLIGRELWKVPKDRLQKNAKEIVHTIFGMDLPDRKYIVIPDAAFTESPKDAKTSEKAMRNVSSQTPTLRKTKDRQGQVAKRPTGSRPTGSGCNIYQFTLEAIGVMSGQ